MGHNYMTGTAEAMAAWIDELLSAITLTSLSTELWYSLNGLYYIGHDSLGPNCIGHNCIGHNCIGHN